MVQIVCTGKGAAMAIPKIANQVYAMAQTQTPSVLYLGTPSYDSIQVFETQTKGWTNCPITKLDLAEVPDSRADRDITYPTKEEMKKLVQDADVIQVSGGNTLYAMKRWQDIGMADILREAAARDDGPVFCGGSAGAICWFEKGNSDSMNPMTFLNPDPNLTEEEKLDWDYIAIDALGILKGLCVPHYDVMQHNNILRAEASDKMLMEEFPEYTLIGIDEEAAFVVNGKSAFVVQGSPDAKVYKKTYNKETQKIDVQEITEDSGILSLVGMGLL